MTEKELARREELNEIAILTRLLEVCHSDANVDVADAVRTRLLVLLRPGREV